MQGSDRRRYLRYEILDYAKVTVGELELTAVVADIGLGGLQIRSRTPLPVGEIVKVEVSGENPEPLILRGEIRHCEKHADSELFASGVRFLPETPQERMAIAEFVHSVFQRQCDVLAID